MNPIRRPSPSSIHARRGWIRVPAHTIVTGDWVYCASGQLQVTAIVRDGSTIALRFQADCFGSPFMDPLAVLTVSYPRPSHAT